MRATPRCLPRKPGPKCWPEVLAAIRLALAEEAEPFGIEMLDVRIKRADFPTEVSGRIFERMRSEREKIARRLRAEGEEEARNRRAAADRDVEIILAGADRDSNRLRVKAKRGDFHPGRCPERRPGILRLPEKLEAYRAFMSQNSTVILSSDAEIFQFLQSPGDSVGAGN